MKRNKIFFIEIYVTSKAYKVKRYIKEKRGNIMKKLIILLLSIILGVSLFKLGFIINKKVELNRYPYKYSEEVNHYSREYDLDPLFVLSVIKVESNFNPDATSNNGAIGLMQITEETGRDIAKHLGNENFIPKDLHDPKLNIEMGCWYLNDLFKEFKNRDLVLAAYNGGRGNVQRWLYDFRYSSNGELINIPFKETQDYVKKVNSDLEVYSRIYSNK